MTTTKIKTYKEDVLHRLWKMESSTIDAAIVDPPFNLGKAYSGVSDNRDDYERWCSNWIAQLYRVIKPCGIIAVKNIPRNVSIMYKLIDSLFDTFVNEIIWRTTSAAHSKRYFWGDHETIIVYAKGDSWTFNTYAQEGEARKNTWAKDREKRLKYQMKDVWDDIPKVYSGSVNHPEVIHKGNGTKQKLHPCQQPIALPERLILFYTNPGDTVLDPFMGTGTTGVAAVRHGRNFIGIEKSKTYYDVAWERIYNGR